MSGPTQAEYDAALATIETLKRTIADMQQVIYDYRSDHYREDQKLEASNEAARRRLRLDEDVSASDTDW